MDCTDNFISVENRLVGMLRTSGVLTGIPVITSAGHTAVIPCELNHLSFEQLLAACIGIDGCGKPAFRIKKIDSCVGIDCDKAEVLNIDPSDITIFFAYHPTEKTIALVLNETA